MKKHINQKLILLLSLSLWQCTKAPNTTSIEKATTKEKNKSSIAIIPTEETPEKVDAKDLLTLHLNVADFRSGPFLTGSLSFEGSGKADYFQYKICPLVQTGKTCTKAENCIEGAGECTEDITPFLRVTLPPMVAGDTTVSVRSCVIQQHAKSSETCGSWETITYNSKRFDDEVASLLRNKTRLINDLGKLGLDYRNILEEFEKEAKECIKFNAAVEKQLQKQLWFTNVFLKAPYTFISEGTKQLGRDVFGEKATSAFSSGMGKTWESFKTHLQNGCYSIGLDGVCAAGQTISAMGGGLLAMLNPLNTIGTLSNAVFTLMDPEKSVPLGCYAETTLAKNHDSITQQINFKLQGLQEIKAALQKKGLIDP